MISKSKGTKITLGGRSFVVACADDQKAILADAVKMVEAKLDEVQRQSKVIGLDRCALLAALNIASDLLEGQSRIDSAGEVNDYIQRITKKINTAIDEQSQLSI